MEPEVDSLENDAAPAQDSAVEPQADTPAEVDTTTDPAPADSSQPGVQTEAQTWVPPAREQWESQQREFEQYKARLAETQRAFHERSQQLKQYEGIDPQTVAAWKQQQQVAARQQLPVWNPSHPEHAKFIEARQKHNYLQQQFKALPPDTPPEEKQRIVNAILNEDEANLLRDYNNYQSEWQHRMAVDPEGAIGGVVQGIVSRMMQEQQRQYAARTTVDTIFNQHGEVLERHRDDVARFLTAQGQDRVEMAAEYALLKEKLAQLERQVQPAQALQAQAKEQQRLLQASATHSTSVGKGIKPTFEEFLRQRGHAPGRQAPLNLIVEYENL